MDIRMNVRSTSLAAVLGAVALAAWPAELVVVPVDDRSYAQPPITVETQRLPDDQRIQAQVIDRLQNDPRLSGRISVEAFNSEVYLSGHTGTAMQAFTAGWEATKIQGVRYVHNGIKPWVGHSL